MMRLRHCARQRRTFGAAGPTGSTGWRQWRSRGAASRQTVGGLRPGSGPDRSGLEPAPRWLEASGRIRQIGPQNGLAASPAQKSENAARNSAEFRRSFGNKRLRSGDSAGEGNVGGVANNVGAPKTSQLQKLRSADSCATHKSRRSEVP